MSVDELERHEREAIVADGESDLVAAALAYATIGWASFPISRARTPLAGSHGYRDASTSPVALRALFSNPDAAGLAIATGASCLVVLDVDPRNGGNETAAKALAGELPLHPIKRTPRDGIHHVFRGPVHSKIATRANALGPGIDVEASGAGVMFSPPTPGYSWELSPFDVRTPFLPYPLWKILPKVLALAPRTRRSGQKRHSDFSLDEILGVLSLLGRLRRSSGGWLAICPAHDDRHNSLSIREGDDGLPLFHCFADCPFKEITAALTRLAGPRSAA